jgi:hypothetical protein
MRKNGIKKITKILTSLSVAMMATQSLAMIQEGSSNGAPLKDETLSMTRLTSGEGKAILSLEDAKVFLGLGEGNANSDTTGQMAGFSLEIPSEIKISLAKQIKRIENDRRALVSRLENEALEKKNAIRENRKKIQLGRISASAKSNESKLSLNLFNSFISESALDSTIKNEVAKFDETNSIELSFVEVAGVRNIQAIQVGMENMWRITDASNQWALLK